MIQFLLSNWLLVLAAVVILILIFRNRHPSGKTLMDEEYRREIDDFEAWQRVEYDLNNQQIREDQRRNRKERHDRYRQWAAAEKKRVHDYQRATAQDIAKFQREHPEPAWARELRKKQEQAGREKRG